MWKCHKCGKPVYFAERKQSLGYIWHPECLRCEECGKRLNPGQHAELFSFNYLIKQRRLKDDEYPLEVRVVLGPHENVARLFLVDKLSTPEISSDVAQFLNLSLAECHGILQRYQYEEERQILLLKEKYKEMRRRIKQRMEELKVRL
ncbi:Ras association domain-containing protein [Ooceraea biroi]|uniref:Ras association domain-containing protein n=1 Tax=Ooceraea biroi TaxID=2015173 RepID=A0A026WY89_OOCBI|nr:Ras association domain-containing protein [Ooceraea biroi]